MLNATFLAKLVHEQAKVYGNKTVMSYRDYEKNEWIPITWTEFSETVYKVSNALLALGVGVQENIAVFSQNKPECLFVDFGAYGIRAVTIPFYATSSEAQISYMIDDAEIRYVFVGEQEQYDIAFRTLLHSESLLKLIIFDKSVVKNSQDTVSMYFDDFLKIGEERLHQKEVVKRMAEAQSADLVNILYTSGTTGVSKGVTFTNEMYHDAMIANDKVLNLTEKDRVLNFLPFTHVFERAWSYYCLTVGMRIAINVDPKDIQNTIREVRPTIMCSVPRFWEKVYSAVQDNLSKMKGVARYLAERAFVIGRRRNVEYLRAGKRVPLWLECQYKFYDKFVFSKIRRAVGVENGNIFPTAGAPLSDTINEFLHICGINIVYGYGLSETTATVSCFDLVGYEFGTVGSLMPDVQVKLGENNEILVKGDTVMKGYYRKPEETAKVFTEDGWFRTGDAGKINGQGALILTERLKDLFKTSNGKYIAPQALETRLGEDKYIDQVAVIGDQRKYVTAIIIPAFEALKEYAAQKQIQYRNLEELVKNQKIEALISERIEALQKNFARFEQIKRFTLLPRAFSMEKGELTNTLKIRRSVINLLYKDEIEAMYA